MARSRNIKPGFFTNEYVADCSDGARLLFIGLWTLADFRGVLEYRPRKIGAEIFPFDEKRNITKLLTELLDNELIYEFHELGKDWIHIYNFTKHQNPHKKEREAGTSCPDPTHTRPTPGQDPVLTGASTELTGLIPDSLIPDPDSLQTLCAKPRTKRKRVFKKSPYPDDFEEFWKDSARTGSKKRAAKQWMKLSYDDKTKALSKIREQVKWRYAWAKADPEHFIPEWKDMERWIRDERFDDDLEWPSDVKKVPKIVDQRDWDIWRAEQKPSPDAPDEVWAKYLSMDVDEYRKAKEAKK